MKTRRKAVNCVLFTNNPVGCSRTKRSQSKYDSWRKNSSGYVWSLLENEQLDLKSMLLLYLLIEVTL